PGASRGTSGSLRQRQARQGGDRRVAAGGGSQGIEGLVLSPSGPDPAGPLQRPREHPPGAHLEVDGDGQLRRLPRRVGARPGGWAGRSRFLWGGIGRLTGSLVTLVAVP